MPSSRKGPVLVVDDDADIREALQDILTGEGYETEQASGGQEALDYLRSHPLPSVILLDWNMAPMNGPQFMDEVAKDATLSAVPVVLVTADARAPVKATSHPFVGYLAKPVKLEALFETVGRYCDKRAQPQ